MSTRPNGSMSSHAGPIRPLEGSAPITEMMDRIQRMIEGHCPTLMKVGGWSGGAAPKDRPRYMLPEEKARILALCHEGHSYGYVSMMTGFDETRIGVLARKNGIKRGCKGNGGAHNVKVPRGRIQ